MKKLSLSLSSFVILILFNILFVYSSEKNIVKGRAIIIDGDTIKINNEKIRFGGIDAPERGIVGHKLSKEKLKKKIGNNLINCIREKNKDYWKRTVAECFINDESLSSFMVINGYACDYVKYSKKKYAKEQQYAKTKKLGIWNMKFNLNWEKKCKKK